MDNNKLSGKTSEPFFIFREEGGEIFLSIAKKEIFARIVSEIKSVSRFLSVNKILLKLI